VGRFIDILTQINDEIGNAMRTGTGAGAQTAGTGAPMQVAVVKTNAPGECRRM
jgi:hypothetical protein